MLPDTQRTCLPGDDAGAASHSVRALFHVTGAADAGLLPRLLEPVAKLGLVPQRVHASSESGDGSLLSVDLRVAGLGPETARRLHGAVQRVVGVQQVVAVFEPVR